MFRSDLVISDEVRWDHVRSNQPDPFDLDLEGIPLGLKIRSDPIRSIIPDLVWSNLVRSGVVRSDQVWSVRDVVGLYWKSSWADWTILWPIRPAMVILGPSWDPRVSFIRAAWAMNRAVLLFTLVIRYFCQMKPSARDRLEIWTPLGIGKMKAGWYQNRSEINDIIERRFIEKT